MARPYFQPIRTTLCPKGIDVYFDNVGGPLLDEVLARINLHARIVLCGAISQYGKEERYGPVNYFNLTGRRSRMEGFLVIDYASRFMEAIAALSGWLREGRLKQKEDVVVGLENAPKTLIRLFTGKNFGKQLLKIADAMPVGLRFGLGVDVKLCKHGCRVRLGAVNPERACLGRREG